MKAKHTHGLSVAAAPADLRQIQLGLRANWRQFTLLVLINAFVGGMVGLERGVARLGLALGGKLLKVPTAS